MIKFNGIDLEETIPELKIEDIQVSPIQITPVARQRINSGLDFIRMTEGSRTITITFAIPVDNIDERIEKLEELKAWAMLYQESQLSLPMFPGKHFDCRCTAYPVPSYRQWWENGMRLVFTTFNNPYLTSDDEIRASCGTQFSVGGTASPMMRIERRLSSMVANQTYAADGKSMFFEKIPAGSLLIDMNRQTAQVSGTSIMQYFGKTSKFIEPRTGNILISGVGTIIYRERWK